MPEPEVLLLRAELSQLREAIRLVEQQLREASMMGKRKQLLAIANRLSILGTVGTETHAA